jgi:sulfite reductase (NADPH) flavoprotein alpha-component
MPPETRRLLAALAVLLVYAAFCAAIAWWYRRRDRRRDAAAAALLQAGGIPLLVAFASQTGTAEQLAWRTAESLQAAGRAARVVALEALAPAALAETPQALFIVSTTGEGDAPDHAAGFLRRGLPGGADLARLDYGLLALGDSGYRQFCAFGRSLDGWLRQAGATPLFDRVEVDDNDDGALRHWQHQLSHLAGGAALPDWSPPRYQSWRLAERRLLNPGSAGAGAFHLRLEPAGGALPDWEAGDIAEIGPRHAPEVVARFLARTGLPAEAPVEAPEGATLGAVLAARLLPEEAGGASPQALVELLPPLPCREYSVASLPADGGVELLVRQARAPDGALGLGSGWLTAHAPLGGVVSLRLRGNRGFHAPATDAPLILIGNGTGLAGLRAHLKARAARGQRRNWLVFGERSAATDFFHREEILAWRDSGLLARLDLTFSRDQPERRYVQHLLAEAAAPLRDWVEEGAVILVSGSLDGMSRGVHEALQQVLGAGRLEALTEQGRYRRDVY